MTQFLDATEVLSKALAVGAAHGSEIESVRHANIPAAGLSALLSDPKGIARAIGVPVQEGSKWNVSTVRLNLASEELRRATVIIIHFARCDGVVIVILE